MPEWSEKELKSVDYKLRTMIFGQMVAKRVAHERASHLESVANQHEEYLMPDFIKSQFQEWIDEHKKFLKKLQEEKRIKKNNRKQNVKKQKTPKI